MAGTPKISVNKLGEYLESNPSRRKKIVIDQKSPSTFIVARYSKAREIAIDYFCNNFDSEIIVIGIQDIEEADNETDFQINDNEKSIEYLIELLDINLPQGLTNYEITKYDGDNPKLNFNGLEVSVNPDLIIRGTYRNKKVVGAIKLHISQNNSLNDDSAKNVATVLHQFVENHIAQPDEIVDLKLCLSIDAFSGVIGCAPQSYFRRRNYILDASQEIVMWWNAL